MNDPQPTSPPIDKNSRIGFLSLALGLIEMAIADGSDGEDARIARYVGVRMLAEVQDGYTAKCQSCGELCMIHKCGGRRD